MVNKYFTTIKGIEDVFVKEEDYLKVVEEKEKLQKSFDMMRDNRDKMLNERNAYLYDNREKDKELKEKDEEILGLEAKLSNNKNRLKKKDEEIQELKSSNSVLNWQSSELSRLTKYISEEKNKYGKAGMLTVSSVIEIIEELEKELKELKDDDYYIRTHERIESLRKVIDNQEVSNNKLRGIVYRIEKELGEKDGKIRELTDLWNVEKQINGNLKEKVKELETLAEYYEKEYVEKEKEVNWTLRYHVNINGKEKEVVQYGMIKEDAEELIGMDSDNWIKWEMEKEVRN